MGDRLPGCLRALVAADKRGITLTALTLPWIWPGEQTPVGRLLPRPLEVVGFRARQTFKHRC